MEACREEKSKIKRCIDKRKKKLSKQFGRKMNEDVNGKGKLFWKEVSNAKGGKVESFSKMMEIRGWYKERRKFEGLEGKF